MEKVFIYDFDGTLTPNPVPKYEILKNCGYDDKGLMQEINISMRRGLDKYEALFDAYFRILNEHGYKFEDVNFILGSNRVEYNEGVEEFLMNNSFKHYLISSGIKVYLDNLTIAKYFTKIYGTTFKYDNGIAIGIDKMINGIEKINCIKEIIRENPNCLIIYFGDGLTDEEAFKYVKDIGGKSLFIINNNLDTYRLFKDKKIIDFGFDSDFSTKGKIYKLVKTW